MKRNLDFLLFVIVCSLVTHTSVFALGTCDDPSAPEQVRIYFANGMNNEARHIHASWLALRGLVGLSEDRSFGKSVNTKEGFLTQLAEICHQRVIEPPQFWDWYHDLSSSPQWFQDKFAQETNRLGNVSYGSDPELRKMVGEYLQDLNSGKKVVIVAHSQGNFYANSSYQYIKDNYPDYRDSIGLVAVGTPSGRVQDGGPHTSNSKDLILNIIRRAFSVLPANMTYDEPFSFINHSFTKTYLAAAGSKIKSDVFSTIAQLAVPEKHIDCKTDEEIRNETPVRIRTTGATNITTSSAKTNGYVESGMDVYVWTNFKEGSAPSTCASNAGSKPETGSYQTGDSTYKYKSGLKSGTIYYYRKCAKGTNNRVSDGGVVSFQTEFVPTIVGTRQADNVGKTTAKVWGGIISGDQINYWWVRGMDSNINCSSSIDTGGGDTGESKSYSWGNLTPGTKYYYRFCGKGRDRTSAGSIKSFTTIAECGGEYQGSGSSEGLHVIYEVGYDPFDRTVQVIFEPYNIPDKLVIKSRYTDEVLLETPGYVSGIQYMSFEWPGVGASLSHKVDVFVYGNSDPDTLWEITVGCMGEKLFFHD